MAFLGRFGSGVGAVLLTAAAANAGAAVAPAADTQSVSERVAAIRAKAAELSGAGVQPGFDGPPQVVAWNDWKNG